MQRPRNYVVSGSSWSTTQFLYLSLRDHCRTVKATGTGISCKIVSPRNVRGPTPAKSQQHGCLNTIWTRTTAIDTLAKTQRPQPQTQNHWQLENSESWRNKWSSPRKILITWLSSTKWSSLRSCTCSIQITLYELSRLNYVFTHTCIYVTMRERVMSLRESKGVGTSEGV